jgi:hypothetical protein
MRLKVVDPASVAGNVSALELIALAKLARVSGASTFFEIGTFDGRTSLNLAANSPEGAVVHTLDLPQEQLDSTRLRLCANEVSYARKDGQRTGWRFRHSPTTRTSSSCGETQPPLTSPHF